MTRKHFQALAVKLHALKPEAGTDDTQWEQCVNGIAAVCADSNPAFNRVRFVEACQKGAAK